jgi:glycosyltransferase involved in cell wall biosynthesis
MSSRRLLICSPSHALFGGVESIVSDLCHELPNRGWDAILALGKGSRFNDVSAYRKAYQDLPITEIDGTKGTRQARVEALIELVERTRPDALLSARIFDSYEAVGECKKRQPKLRLAVTIQAYEPQYLYDLRAYRDNVDLCVTSGKVIRMAAIHWCNLPENRVVSIPGGVSASTVPLEPRHPRVPIRIGYVGRLDQDQKRILDAEPLLRELDKRGIDYALDMVGTGPYETELSRRLANWVDQGRVRFHGWQSKDRLYLDFFPNMDCLVHFSHTEGVTIAPREAMIHGVVPVISQFTGLKAEQQFVHEFNSLTFPVGDMESAAASIGRLMSEPGLLLRLSKNALTSQNGNYTFAGSMDAWAEALDRCLEQPPALGHLLKLRPPADGRLARMGLSPRAAQRIRDLLRRRHSHTDPGSEWPTGSGLLTEEAAAEIMRFAADYERSGESVVTSSESSTGRTSSSSRADR